MISKINWLLSEEGIEELSLWCAPQNITVVTNNRNGREPYLSVNDPIIKETTLTVELQLQKDLKNLISEYIRAIDKQLFSIKIHSERILFAEYIVNTTKVALSEWSNLPSLNTYPIIRSYLDDLYTQVKTKLSPLIDLKKSESSFSKVTANNQVVFTFRYFYTDAKKTGKFIDALLSTGWIGRSQFDKPHEENDPVRKDLMKVFSGRNINRPVAWTGPKNQLCYLITQLYKRKLLLNASKDNYWDMATNSFIRTNGAKYDKRSLQVTKSPVSTIVIDSLLDSV
ncbi:hypothetical protein ACSX1A_17475 [Pontibacter sp. MBLB2868]|uniref:hypothetical protein n=1 Tax=Pontibacter sp. MBLB2868 TaxID=3451555 RepID=UPI003F756FB1